MEKTATLIGLCIIQALGGALAMVALVVAGAVGAIDAAHAVEVSTHILSTAGFMLCITAVAAAVAFLVERK